LSAESDAVQRAMAGDHEAFSRLAERSMGKLYRSAILILRNRDEAEEAVQEAIIRAWRWLPTLRDPQKFDGWLYRLLVHACQDEVRKRDRALRHFDSGHIERGRDQLAAILDNEELDEPLSRLTPDQRAVLVLVYYLGFSLRDAAPVLGIRVGTLKSRLHRSLRALQSDLTRNRPDGTKQEVIR